MLSGLLDVGRSQAMEWDLLESEQQNISLPKVVEPEMKPNTPLTWTVDESSEPTTKKQNGLNWTAISETEQTETDPASNAIVWEQIELGDVITADEIEQDKAPVEVLITNEPSGTTFANHRALYRDDQVLPQISSLVPVGFGPQGLMLTGAIYGTDCTASGICTEPQNLGEYRNQIESFGEAQWEWSLGLGNSEKLLGLTVTTVLEETQLPFGSRNTQGLETDQNFFDEYYIGLHLSRHIGPDTGVRIGVNNWLDVKECGLNCGLPKSAYGVISQRFRLKDDQNTWFPNAYLTLGVGNGEFRPLGEQVRSSIAAQRAAGCQTYGYIPDKPCTNNTLRRAVLDAANYGELTPIGAAALEVYPGFNAIGEWSGRNLNLGFSVKPFEEIGLVFTTMWNNLLQNCDYGCDIHVPDYPDPVPLPDNMITFRPVWSFHLSLDVKF